MVVGFQKGAIRIPGDSSTSRVPIIQDLLQLKPNELYLVVWCAYELEIASSYQYFLLQSFAITILAPMVLVLVQHC